MKFDLTQFDIQDIIIIRDKCNDIIYDYVDEYVYFCKVRSYGRVWDEKPNNIYELEELCRKYDGYDGIVDIYSTHPNLLFLMNYGKTCFIESEDDYKKWVSYNSLVNQIKEIEELWERWDNRENSTFRERPTFEPYCTKGELKLLKKQLEDFDMSFIPPREYE